MSTRSRGLALLFFIILLAASTAHAVEKDVLIADRLSNRVLRYGPTGQFLNVVVDEAINDDLDEVNGITLSPDFTKLYVSSRANHRLVRYDYDVTTGLGSNPFVFADLADGVISPASLLFDSTGTVLYSSNQGTRNVNRFLTNGTFAGPPLAGGAIFARSGLAFFRGDATTPDRLLVGGFQGIGGTGSVMISDGAISSLTDWIGPQSDLDGVAGLLVHGNDLYITALFDMSVRKYNLLTKLPDPTFTPITGDNFNFDAPIVLNPDGSGILVGVLGFGADGYIGKYDFNGNVIGNGIWANNSTADPSHGFVEATGLFVIPEPSSLALVCVALVSLGWTVLRHRGNQQQA